MHYVVSSVGIRATFPAHVPQCGLSVPSDGKSPVDMTDKEGTPVTGRGVGHGCPRKNSCTVGCCHRILLTALLSCLCPQTQGSSKQKVLVMEYCSSGSLLNMLEDPENAFGLSEAEFLIVLNCVGESRSC